MNDFEKAQQFICISCLDEVRYSFVSHLSEALRRKGINAVVVGVDGDDLLSKESQAKVEKARVSVMVLPGNCEPTTACLEKFEKFLECQSNNDHVVVPVLYGESPLKGEWLSVPYLKGLSPVHQSRTECSDSELVEEIVRDVYEKLFYTGRIGIYSKLLEMENMVRKQPLGIRCVGIWGMPGIGKTTLAKAVFDQISGNFETYCFIEDYDKASHEKGLYRLLEEQFLKEKPGTGSTAFTKLSLLRDKLNNKRVLVVLDDVRNPLVAESFLEGFDWFGPESLIIITSRDKQVFRLCRIHQIYEVQGLNEKEALQLFSLCASLKDTMEPNLHELSMKVIKYANGNPLALSIYGKELKGKKKLSEMETAFLKHKRRPPFKIVDAYKSSYDTLSDSEKNIFLDIACFFRGENIDYVMQLLEGCGFFPHVGIDVLVEKCLVTISENRVQMHNLTQDVGREIINGETIQIERRSRLWEPWSIRYLLEDNEHKANTEPKTTFKRAQGTEEIEGIFLDTSTLSFDVKPAAFENMLKLRLLKIYCSNSDSEVHPVINFPKGLLHFLPDELRLLHWENYPLQSLPQTFYLRHLVEINMPYSQLQKLWCGTKTMEMLKTIRLSHSRQLVDIDDLLKAPSLEVIDLQGCTKLQSFQPTGKLLHLRVVNLSGCTEIQYLPEVSPNIETLHLQGTGIRTLPLSIVKPNSGELANLLAKSPHLSDALKLDCLISLAKSSSSSQDLGKLICLELKDCSRLRSLPNMVNLVFLKVLDLSGCLELETIQGFPQNLKELYLAGTVVREVPQLPKSLELLNAHGCVSLTSIRLDSEQLPMHYTFSNCFHLSSLLVNDFLVTVLANVKRIPREHPQELDKTLAFSFCAPSHVSQDSTLDLQPGSSVMTQLNPSWRSTLVGFAMLVEVAFSEDYNDATGFGIRCVCRWKNKTGHSHGIERNLHCWVSAKAVPKVQKDHMFVFCDVKMCPSTGEGKYPDILADLVVFEFFPVNKQRNRLDDTCTVKRCGVYAITSVTGNTSLENISPALSSDPMEFSGIEGEDVLRVSYAGLPERHKALFLYIACLFNDEVVDLVAQLIARIDLDVSSGFKVLANRSLIRVSPNGGIAMHRLLRQMGKEILDRQSMLSGSSKYLARDFGKVSMACPLSRDWKYDLFPSFCAENIRRTFLSHMLAAFNHRSINTFMNDEIEREKPINRHITQAIRESRVLMVVFSKSYASSSWSLNELVEIAESKEELGQILIPVFYGIDPSDVRNQTGEFGECFKKTCVNKTEDEKQRWGKALTSIANISGHVSENWESDVAMIEAIANDILKNLNQTAAKDFDDLVGIEDHISEMSSLSSFESELVRMVGIWGPSGIGKTTIARALYSRLARWFQYKIFVDKAFVSAAMGYYRRVKLDDHDTKLHLQTKFLSEVLGQKSIVVHHGTMREKLKDKKVLIILDDADDQMLLDALVGDTRWFGSRSRIIVVSKDKGLLNFHGIGEIYKVELPSKKQALQMLCQSAFEQNYPPEGFMELAVDVVEAVGNLPLGLKVLGSTLKGKHKTEWKDILPLIRYSLHGEIEEILKVAYDRLHDQDKEIFLYIACLFNYSTVESVTRLLPDRDLSVVEGLNRLLEKSFIHISEHGKITMYNLQQNLGRQIIRWESTSEPGRRRFLVSSPDICDVLVENTGTESILGISLDMSEINDLIISERGFKGMENLLFLKFYTNLGNKQVKVHLPHGLDYLSRKLRLLHWEAFPMSRMPSNFAPEYLVELVMEASMLEKLWSGVQPLGSLKCMSLRGSLDLREIPDLSYATNLEKLDLGGCSSLTMLPSSIRNLHKLRDLDMEGCIKLEVLPTGINLEALYCLNLKGCSRLRCFPEISRNISDLYLDGTAIEEVPWWIENISSLSYLSMNGCNKLKKISPNISKLKHLVEVDLSECEALTEDSWKNHPEEISTSLMIVDMSGNSFERLPDTWTSIKPKDLIFNNCRNLVSLPELPASLSMIAANNCESLESLCGSFHFPQTALQFINCSKLNHQARELILQSDCSYAIFPGGELPAHFTHRADGSFLTISLPQSSLSKKYPSFKACIMVGSRSGLFYFGVLWPFGGGSDKIDYGCLTNTPSTRNHLIVFHCEFSPDQVNDSSPEMNYSNLQFEFFCLDHRKEMIKIQECGIQLLEVSPSAGDIGNSSEAEETRSSKRMRIT